MNRIEKALMKPTRLTIRTKKAIVEAIRMANMTIINHDVPLDPPDVMVINDIKVLNETVDDVPMNFEEREQRQEWPGDAYVVCLTENGRIGAAAFLGRMRMGSFRTDDEAVGVHALYQQIKPEKAR